MAMNREQKRAMQKRGLAGADGAPVQTRERRQPTARPAETRTPIRQVIQEIFAEMRKTSWPTREETIRLAIIVFIAIVVLTLFIFGLDLAFGAIFDRLFDTTPDPSAAAAAALHLIRVA
jgi:preprotein translocase subunit SecE